ncbi:hypothetical protein EVAR_61644_1 [Eumeta japonica]|uniref:Uncharacterized protein n=1 Tax=Eumeta variegata TaxID=151549 RepID=A0A4C1Z9Y6_EUMVA|nr:hypothetical protein EVAR_61644_1 [Eumeta japonica]
MSNLGRIYCRTAQAGNNARAFSLPECIVGPFGISHAHARHRAWTTTDETFASDVRCFELYYHQVADIQSASMVQWVICSYRSQEIPASMTAELLFG